MSDSAEPISMRTTNFKLDSDDENISIRTDNIKLGHISDVSTEEEYNVEDSDSDGPFRGFNSMLQTNRFGVRALDNKNDNFKELKNEIVKELKTEIAELKQLIINMSKELTELKNNIRNN